MTRRALITWSCRVQKINFALIRAAAAAINRDSRSASVGIAQRATRWCARGYLLIGIRRRTSANVGRFHQSVKYHESDRSGKCQKFARRGYDAKSHGRWCANTFSVSFSVRWFLSSTQAQSALAAEVPFHSFRVADCFVMQIPHTQFDRIALMRELSNHLVDVCPEFSSRMWEWVSLGPSLPLAALDSGSLIVSHAALLTSSDRANEQKWKTERWNQRSRGNLRSTLSKCQSQNRTLFFLSGVRRTGGTNELRLL